MAASGRLPKQLEEQRKYVFCGRLAPDYTSTVEYAGAYASLGLDNSLDLEALRRGLRIDVKHISNDGFEMEFDLVGVDAPIANAIRRILIAEVPTMAIEKVWILANTSIIPDEVLAHRLGLIPIKAEPSIFEENRANENTAFNTITFKLHIKCERNAEAADKDQPYVNDQVLSSALRWIPPPPDEDQKAGYEDLAAKLNADPPGPVHDDILVAKMRPGQEINLEAWAEKGVGRTHAKWSPVATASYRLLPRVTLLEPVTAGAAAELRDMCPMKVFDIEDMDGVQTAVAKHPRRCTMCRECVREPEWAERVQLTRAKDHFLFSVESTGVLPAERLVRDALDVLKQKALTTAQLLEDAMAQSKEALGEDGDLMET